MFPSKSARIVQLRANPVTSAFRLLVAKSLGYSDTLTRFDLSPLHWCFSGEIRDTCRVGTAEGTAWSARQVLPYSNGKRSLDIGGQAIAEVNRYSRTQKN